MELKFDFHRKDEYGLIIILQIITVVISIVTLISNIVITTIENKKKHYLNWTTSYRLKTMEKTQELISDIVVFSTPNVLKCVTDKSIHIEKLIKSKTDLDLLFKKWNREEVEIGQLIDNIIYSVLEYLEEFDPQIEEELNEKLKKLLWLFSIYDSTDWKFIKLQSATGKIYDNKKWLEIYKYYKNKLNNVTVL